MGIETLAYTLADTGNSSEIAPKCLFWKFNYPIIKQSGGLEGTNRAKTNTKIFFACVLVFLAGVIAFVFETFNI